MRIFVLHEKHGKAKKLQNICHSSVSAMINDVDVFSLSDSDEENECPKAGALPPRISSEDSSSSSSDEYTSNSDSESDSGMQEKLSKVKPKVGNRFLL